MSSFRPDLLLRGSTETVVVEVKRRRRGNSLGVLEKLSQAVQQNPGWRLEVLYVDEEGRLDEVGSAPDVASLVRRLDEVEALYQQGMTAAAALLLRSTIEAISKALLGPEKEARRRGLLSLIAQLVHEGFITQADYQLGTEFVLVTNRIAHGELDVPIGPTLFGKALGLARSLLGEFD